MMQPRSLRIRAVHLVFALLTIVAAAQAVAAQSRVRVTSDQVTIWRPGFTTVATVVSAGTILDVVRRSGDWYEVVVPGSPYESPQTGFIAITRVEPADGSTPPTAQPRTQSPSRPSARPAPRRPATSPPPARRPGSDPWKGFVQFGYGRFTAERTFDAVLGSSLGPWFGGGVRYGRRTGIFIDGSVEHFRSTGERVFVDDGTVFSLGVEDTVYITPLMASGGYRLGIGRAVAYGGAGVGAYLFRETSAFADDDENVSQTNAAYRGLAGIEWPFSPRYALDVEVQYTSVPDALSGGAAAALQESNLGGIHLVARIVFGR
jgi:opacity protein-like surface antigen